eukprot:6042850-Prymnesium_polylepis.1
MHTAHARARPRFSRPCERAMSTPVVDSRAVSSCSTRSHDPGRHAARAAELCASRGARRGRRVRHAARAM